MAYCLAVHTLWDDVVALKTTIEKRASAQSQLSSRLVLYLCAKAGFVLCLPVTITMFCLYRQINTLVQRIQADNSQHCWHCH